MFELPLLLGLFCRTASGTLNFPASNPNADIITRTIMALKIKHMRHINSLSVYICLHGNRFGIPRKISNILCCPLQSGLSVLDCVVHSIQLSDLFIQLHVDIISKLVTCIDIHQNAIQGGQGLKWMFVVYLLLKFGPPNRSFIIDSFGWDRLVPASDPWRDSLDWDLRSFWIPVQISGVRTSGW